MTAFRWRLTGNASARRAVRTAWDPVLLLVLGVLSLLAGCQWQGEEANFTFGWERMIDQKKYDAYEPADVFPDGKVMRTPPEGTLHREAPQFPARVLSGREDGGRAGAQRLGATDVMPTAPSAAAYVSRVPLALAISDLRRGRERFEIYCAVCHGIDGSGISRVAMNMSLRPPPSLVEDPIRSFSPGRIYETITQGYGLMPSYAAELRVTDRWRVVSYVQALQLARRAKVDSLPPQVRAEVLRELQNGGAVPGDTVPPRPAGRRRR